MKTKLTHIAVGIAFVLTALTTRAQNWLTTGNNGTNPATNFLGTLNNKAIVFRTNNVERMRITGQGSIGIGTNMPVAQLQISAGTAVQLSSGGYVVVGSTNKTNLALDTNVLQTRFNNSYADLYLNPLGGTTHIGSYNSNGADIRGNTLGLSVYGANGTGIYAGTTGGDGSFYGGYFYNYDGIGVYGYDEGGGHQGIYGYSAGSGEGIYGMSISGKGVYGYSAHGYGVYGSTGDAGSYAGYFNGNVYTSGTFQGSDENLKQHIRDFTSAMNIIKQLHPKEYEYRQDGSYKLMNLPQGQHYGLIAQDVEKILPDLVKDTKFDVDRSIVKKQEPYDPKNPNAKLNNEVGKTGEVINFKALNYTELIPIIIKGMQEQQQSIEELKQINQQQQQQIDELKAMIVSNQSATNNHVSISSASIAQNIPNPFTNTTSISYSLPVNCSSAKIIISDKNGIALKQINLTKTQKGSVQVDVSTLASGAYQYSLYINDKLIDTKQMLLTK